MRGTASRCIVERAAAVRDPVRHPSILEPRRAPRKFTPTGERPLMSVSLPDIDWHCSAPGRSLLLLCTSRHRDLAFPASER